MHQAAGGRVKGQGIKLQLQLLIAAPDIGRAQPGSLSRIQAVGGIGLLIDGKDFRQVGLIALTAHHGLRHRVDLVAGMGLAGGAQNRQGG